MKQVYAMTPIAHDLPLVDLHRHLDGNVRLETVLELGRMHGVALPADTVEGLRPFGQVQGVAPSLMDFIAKFELLKLAFVDEDAIARIAEENIEDAHREGIAYLELARTHIKPFTYLTRSTRLVYSKTVSSVRNIGHRKPQL